MFYHQNQHYDPCAPTAPTMSHVTFNYNYNYWLQWQQYLDVMLNTEIKTQPRFPVHFFNADKDEASTCSSPCNEERDEEISEPHADSPKSWADMVEDEDEMIFDENFQL